MFGLDAHELDQKILGCGDGPASFNATFSRRGGSVLSVDPIYRFTTEEIARRIDKTYDIIMEQTRQNAHEFVWSHIRSPEELGKIRIRAMRDFLADFPGGKDEGRYIPAELPDLPFPDQAFGLALCSHFLFLYSAQLDIRFHLRSLRELCRVARDVRIFPILELGSKRSRHIDEVLAKLSSDGYEVRIERVAYEFQKGGNEMLRLRRTTTGADSDATKAGGLTSS